MLYISCSTSSGLLQAYKEILHAQGYAKRRAKAELPPMC